MEQSDQTKVLVTVERIEGKIDRMNDRMDRLSERMKEQEKRIDAVLDIVTGSESGAERGLIVRVMTLEQKMLEQQRDIQETKAMNARLDSLGDQVMEVLRMQKEHPPLLYLLRFQPRKTIMWIVFIFVLLSIWYVSGIRQPILEFFGLPVF